MWILLFIAILIGIVYLSQQQTERTIVNKIEICGKNKVVVNGACVCDESAGFYPMIGAFGPDHSVCHSCTPDLVKVVDGIKACDPDGLGSERELKKNPNLSKPTPAEADEQCGQGQILNKDSKCEPAPVPPSGDADSGSEENGPKRKEWIKTFEKEAENIRFVS